MDSFRVEDTWKYMEIHGNTWKCVCKLVLMECWVEGEGLAGNCWRLGDWHQVSSKYGRLNWRKVSAVVHIQSV